MRKRLSSDPSKRCPHCDKTVIVTATGLEAYNEEAADEGRNKLQAKIEEALAKLSDALQLRLERDSTSARANAEATTARKQRDAALADVKAAERRASRKGEVDTPERRTSLAAAEQDVETAKAVVKMVRDEANAAELHETIVRYTEIAKAIGPSGIRARLLETGMKKLNGGLRIVSDVAGWPVVEVADTGTVTIDGRAAALGSESETVARADRYSADRRGNRWIKGGRA